MNTKHFILSIWLLLLCTVAATAQKNTLSIPDVSVAPGKTISLPINLDNTADVVAVQFSLTVPDGITLAASSASLSERSDGHSVTMKQKGQNTYMAMVFSANNTAIVGRTGKLLSVTLTASSTLEEGSVLPLTLSDVVIAGNDGANLTTGYSAGNVTIAKRPDLEVSSVTATPTEITPNGTITVNWQVANIGGLSTEAGWSENVYLDAEDGTSKLLGTIYYEDKLSAGGTVSRSADFTLPQILGLDGKASVRVKLTPNSDAGEPIGLQDNNTAQTEATFNVSKLLTLTPTSSNVEEDENGNVRFQLTRSGSTANAETFPLTATADSRVTLPKSVTIEKGQSGVYFYAQIAANKQLDNDSIVNISVSGNGYGEVAAQMNIEDDIYPSLSLTAKVEDVTEGGSLVLTITTERASNSDIEVKLVCDHSSRFAIPSQITIPAGSTSVDVTVETVEDDTPSAEEVVTFTASAASHNPATLNTVIVDNDVPTLTLELTPNAVSEGDGPLSVSAKLRRTDNINKVVTVKFTDDSDGGIYYGRQSVEMASGVEEVLVNLGPIDNTTVDGERTYNISGAVWIASCSCNASNGTSGGIVTVPLTVYDNDGPTLTLSSSASVLKEGGEVMLTVSRNTSTTEALTVSLSSDHDSQIDYPFTVTIAAGETSSSFTVKSESNDVSDDGFIATLTASAEGYAKSTTYFSVTDQTLPDAQITAIELSEAEKEVGGTATVKLTVANTGSYELPELTKVGIHVGSTTTTAYLQSALAAGETVEISKEITLPTSVGTYNVYAVANESQETKELLYTNNTSSMLQVKAVSPFTVMVATDKATYKKGETVNITGQITGSNVASQSVEIYVINDGYRHTITAETDANGAFSATYQPYDAQMGHFVLGACYPNEETKDEMASFDFYGLKRTSSSAITCETLFGGTYNGSFSISNPGNLSLSGITATVVSKPENCDVQISCPTSLNGGETATISYSLLGSAISSGNDWEKIVLNIETTEGATLSTTLYYYCRNPKAQIQADIASIKTTMTKGITRSYPITITNIGKGETGTISLSLPTSGWMKAATPLQMASLENGESSTIILQLTPTESQQLNVPITGNIAINCDNGDGISIPFSVTPVSEEKGTLVVDVCDEWTYNTTEAPHVANADVTIKDVNTGKTIANGTTDENGLFSVELSDGYYSISVDAERHDSYTNNVLVDPGVETREVVDLCYQAIEISYELEETGIEDQYKIVHIVNYETNVPKPVVIIDGPTSIEGEEMGNGEQKILYFTLTNKGLVRTDNVRFSLPEATSEWEFEALAYAEPFPLAANQSVIIPVVLTHYPNGISQDAKSIRKASTSTPDIVMGACMAEMTATYEVLCGTKLYDNVSAHRMAMKACATSAIINAIAQGVGIGSIGGVGGGVASGPGSSPNSSTKKDVDSDEEKTPVVIESDKTICDPCYADLMDDLLDKMLDKTPLKYINDGANAAYDKARNPNKSLRGIIGDKIGDYIEDNDPTKPDNPLLDLTDDIEGLDEAMEDYENCKKAQQNKQKVRQRRTLAYGWIEAYWDAIRKYKEQINSLTSICEEMFGDSVWYFTRDNMMKPFWQQVIMCDKEKPLDYDYLLQYKPSSVSTEQLKALIDRLNETSDTNKPNIDNLLANAKKIDSIDEDAIEAGYENMADMFIASQEDFSTRSKEQSKSVCSTITLKFEQQMVMTRQAFRGTLKVFNANETTEMSDVKLTLTVTDEEGNAATSHEFQINMETLNGFAGELNFSDGWTLAAEETGTATVLFIPTKYAAPTENKKYLFGGSLSYIDPYTGLEVTRELSPVTLTVKPSPNLALTYFMQRDIIGDDPLTVDVVEPCEEAEFSLLINNTGYGDATNVKMTTEQPEIIDNEKGLAIEFELMSSQLNGGDATLALGGSVVTDFGTIPAKGTSYAQWWLKSSLLGHFTNYDIEATHVTSYGNEDLSLLDTVTIHELIRSLDVESGSTKMVGFMTNDIVDADDTPDMLYLSNGTTENVAVASSSSMTKTSETDYELTINPSATGWNYGNLKDPTYGVSALKSVVRKSDGKEMSLRNFWQTDRTLRDGKDPLYENRIHFADDFTSQSAETYTLIFEPTPELLLEVAAIEGVPAEDSVAFQPVDTVKVVLNKHIDATTFTEDDMVMRIQGEKQDASPIKITTEDNKTFTLDFTEFNKTSGNGYHTLTVQTADITDYEGYQGKDGKSVGWIMFREGYVKLLTSAYPANSGSVKRSSTNAAKTRRANAASEERGDKTEYGSTVTLLAEPNKGYEFSSWTLNGEEVSTNPTYECTALSDMDVVANFSKKNYNVTVVADIEEGGTVEGNATGIYAYGEELTFIANPSDDYIFGEWMVGDKSLGDADTLTVTVDSAMTVTAKFVRDIYEQRLKLSEGWNWISTYLQEPLSVYEFTDRANRIIGPSDEVIYDPENDVDSGVDSIAAGFAYKVDASFSLLKTFKGHMYNVYASPISLKSGWNWMAYLYNDNRLIAETVTNADDGDCIASQGGYAEYTNGNWEGSISTFVPGEGYLYKSSTEKNLHFNFQTSGATMDDQSKEIMSEAGVDIRKYPNTMNITAQLYENGQNISSDAYTIYAMDGNELCGFGQFIGSNYYITVYGEQNVDISFVVKSSDNSGTSIANETLTFTNDLVGSRKSPFGLSIGEPTGISTIDGNSHKLRVYSVEGVLISADGDVETLKSLMPGVYIVNGRKYLVK